MSLERSKSVKFVPRGRLICRFSRLCLINLFYASRLRTNTFLLLFRYRMLFRFISAFLAYFVVFRFSFMILAADQSVGRGWEYYLRCVVQL